MEQFKNLSSWRQDDITIKAGEVYSLAFLDTKPNMFYVQNPNNCKLFVSISNTPSKKKYEFLVNPNSSEPLGRPMPTGYLYLLNGGTTEANVRVFSIADTFDLNVLKNFVVNLAGVTVEAMQEIKFADGVSLPSGTNNIGKVSLDYTSENNLLNVAEATTESNETINECLPPLKKNSDGLLEKTSAILGEILKPVVGDVTRHLITEIADGIKKINEDGIGTSINGDVYIDPKTFWYGKTDDNYSFITEVIDLINGGGSLTNYMTGYVAITDILHLMTMMGGSDFEIFKIEQKTQGIFKTKIYEITLQKNANDSVNLVKKIPFVDLENYDLNYVNNNEVFTTINNVDIISFFTLFQMFKEVMTNNGLIVNNASAFPWSGTVGEKEQLIRIRSLVKKRNIGGILNDCRTVTRSFSKTVSVNSGSFAMFINPDDLGGTLVAYNHVELIQAIESKFEISFQMSENINDIVSIVLEAGEKIQNINWNFYKITASNKGTGTGKITIIGGLY